MSSISNANKSVPSYIQPYEDALNQERTTQSTTDAAMINASSSPSMPVNDVLPMTDPMSNPTISAGVEQMVANYPSGNTDLSPTQINDVYGSQIDNASKSTGVPSGVLTGMIWTESKGNPLVSSGGLMQVGPVEFANAAAKNPDLNSRYDPGDNIMAGAMTLKDKNGGQTSTNPSDWTKALQAYSVNDPDYAAKVLSHMG